MDANVFDFLMVVAVGSLAGTGIGILIAYGAKKQKSQWSEMSRKDQTINSALIIIFCAICCGGLGYYFLI